MPWHSQYFLAANQEILVTGASASSVPKSTSPFHYKVFKDDVKGKTTTHLKLLSEEERIVELSEMLEGKNSGASARNHAIELLRKG